MPKKCGPMEFALPSWEQMDLSKANVDVEIHPDHARHYVLPDEYGVKNFDVQAGDFVEVRKSTTTYLGVILPIPEDREVLGAGQGASHIMVLATGELEQIRATDIMLQMPGFVDVKTATMAAPLKWDHVLASASRQASPSNLDTDLSSDTLADAGEPFDYKRFSTRAKICRKIREMQRELDREIRRIYPAFRTLFLEEEDARMLMEQSAFVKKEHKLRKNALDLLQSGHVPTSTVAVYLEQYLANSGKRMPVKASTMLATHSLLMSHPTQFLADSISHRRSQSFVYRSQKEQQILKRVSEWVHHFISETDVDKSRVDGKDLFRWTENDKDILAFFKISLGNRRELQDNTTGSIAMTIIKQDVKELDTDIAQAGFDLQHSQMFNFLVDLGVLAPWENPNAVNSIFKDAALRDKSQDSQSERDLRLLAEAASVIFQRRIHPLPLPSLSDQSHDTPKFFRGFPKIQLLTQEDLERRGSYDNLPGGISAESMVSEMMILAGRIAASFGMDHEIPLPHRIQAAPERSDIEVIEKMKHPDHHHYFLGIILP
ncbi:exoribonuclease II [Malassezia equina]|uniref:Exoribonuclease II n=1 Tax=Malassezia equina TaxID=1381935 RepID=A0AAF0ED27_9BASI|nr:exoribonuclease II [Malassezia equina]